MYEKSPPAACTRIRYFPGPLLYSSELSTQTSTNISSKPSYTYNRSVHLLQYSSIKQARCHKNSSHSTLQDFVPARPTRLYSTPRSILYSSELSTQTSTNISSKPSYTYNRGLLLLQHSSIKHARCHKNSPHFTLQDFVPARPIRLYSTSRSPLFSSELSTQSSNNFSSKTNYTSNRGVHLLQYSSIKQARCHKNFEFSSPQDFIPLFINRQLYRRLQLRVPPANHDRPVANPPKLKKPRELRNRNNIFKTASFWHKRYTVIFFYDNP